MADRYVTQPNRKSKLNRKKASMNSLTRPILTPLLLGFALLLLGGETHAESNPSPVTARLLADTTAIRPGQPFTAGVLLQAEPCLRDTEVFPSAWECSNSKGAWSIHWLKIDTTWALSCPFWGRNVLEEALAVRQRPTEAHPGQCKCLLLSESGRAPPNQGC